MYGWKFWPLMISQAVVVFYKVQEEKLLFVELSGKVSQWKSLFMLHTDDDYRSSGLVKVLQTTRKHAELTGTNLPYQDFRKKQVSRSRFQITWKSLSYYLYIFYFIRAFCWRCSAYLQSSVPSAPNSLYLSCSGKIFVSIFAVETCTTPLLKCSFGLKPLWNVSFGAQERVSDGERVFPRAILIFTSLCLLSAVSSAPLEATSSGVGDYRGMCKTCQFLA